MDYSKIKKELGLRIKSFRNEQNLTQEKFISIIELEQANLSNIENGKAAPKLETVCSIINKFNLEPNYLLDFLRNEHTAKNSLDFEIIELLISLPYEVKKHFRDFLKSLQK